MKLIKTLLLFVVISVITFSCKDTKKEEVGSEMDAVEETVEVAEVEGDDGSTEVVEAVEVESASSEAAAETSEDVEVVEVVEASSAGLVEVEVEGIIVEATADTPVIYPGCEGGSADEIRACSRKKFIAFLQKNFNTNLATSLDLRSGAHKIRSLVKIDEAGSVSVLKIDGPSKALEKEVTRVIDKLPQMTAATNEGQPVSVSFILPIDFEIK